MGAANEPAVKVPEGEPAKALVPAESQPAKREVLGKEDQPMVKPAKVVITRKLTRGPTDEEIMFHMIQKMQEGAKSGQMSEEDRLLKEKIDALMGAAGASGQANILAAFTGQTKQDE